MWELLFRLLCAGPSPLSGGALACGVELFAMDNGGVQPGSARDRARSDRCHLCAYESRPRIDGCGHRSVHLVKIACHHSLNTPVVSPGAAVVGIGGPDLG